MFAAFKVALAAVVALGPILSAATPTTPSQPSTVSSRQQQRAAPPVAVWEWRHIGRTPSRTLHAGMTAAQTTVNATSLIIDISSLVDISEIPDPQQRITADSAYRRHVTAYNHAAHQRGLAVSALVGTPGWSHPDAWYTLPLVQQWVSALNQQLPPPQRIRMLGIDVEPWGTPAWKTATPAQKQRAIIDWLGLLATASRDQTTTPTTQRIPLRVDVPLWLDGTCNPTTVTFQGVTASPTAHLFRILDNGTPGNTVLVMAYKDTVAGKGGSAVAVRREFQYAAARRGRVQVVIGQEFAPVPGEPETVTFHQEGLPALRAAIRALATRYTTAPGFAGFAVDHAAALTPTQR